MPIQEYENVKGFTFIQSTEPAESKSKEHDTWYNTSNNKIYMFQNYRWKMYVNAIYFPGADYGYVCGGGTSSSIFSTIDRITFPFDSGTASHVGNLSGTRYSSASCNSSNYGYTCGGYDGSNHLSTIDRFSFPFDSGTASHVGNLSVVGYHRKGCNSSDYGFICGALGPKSIIDRITFPFDSGTATHVGNLSQTKSNPSATDGTDFVTLFDNLSSRVYV